MKGLVLAAVAAVVAAVVTSTFFPKGALITTAVTPVIVTVVRESLRKPAERITATAARVAAPPARGAAALAGAGARSGAEQERFGRGRLDEPDRATTGGDGRAAANGGERVDRVAAPPPPPIWAPPPPLDDTRAYDPTRTLGAGDADPTGDAAPAVAAGERAERKVYGRRRLRPKVVLVTALAAFVIAVGALTIPELLFGGSVAGDRSTTLFGGPGSGQVDAPAGDGAVPGTEPAPSDGTGSEPRPAPEQEQQEAEPAPEEPAPQEPAPQSAPPPPAPSG